MKNAMDEIMRVLATLPLADQQAIRECWRQLSNGRPDIELSSQAALVKRRVRWAATDGAKYYFREELFSNSKFVPSDVLRTVIAHELAHTVYAVEDREAELKERIVSISRRFGIGPESVFSRAVRKAIEYSHSQIKRDFQEGKAWWKAQGWGVDQQGALTWLEQNLP